MHASRLAENKSLAYAKTCKCIRRLMSPDCVVHHVSRAFPCLRSVPWECIRPASTQQVQTIGAYQDCRSCATRHSHYSLWSGIMRLTALCGLAARVLHACFNSVLSSSTCLLKVGETWNPSDQKDVGSEPGMKKRARGRMLLIRTTSKGRV